MSEYVVVIFGASGDLAKRKLIPALYHLIQKYNVQNFCIIGGAFDKITTEDLIGKVKQQILNVDEERWAYFASRFFYHHIDFRSEPDYTQFKAQIDNYKNRFNLHKCNTLIYFATASYFFSDITTYIAKTEIAKRISSSNSPWTRLIYEKPFGHDLLSAHTINSVISQYFNEDQIYRIDHYLTKELVGNIALVRFTNLVFEPLWNNRYIDNVQIILSENENIGSRGQYYDHFGAISDVMQNHMLELLALIGMETPKTLYGNHVRDERANVLKKVKVVDAFYGQYETYKNEPFVDKQSKTETFAAAFLRIDNPRWAGVPFYLKTGKCLSKKETVIHIKFKSVDCLLTTCSMSANILTIEISPNAGFSLRLNAKKPGEAHEVIPVTMDFCHSCIFGNLNEQAYETLLEGVIRGEQSVSVRFDEIEYAWKIIDTLKKEKYDLFLYPCGSDGPTEIEQFNKKHGIRWLS